jgi:hypothetical protein
MKRQAAMIVAGMFSTLIVVGGTIAAAQSGAFTGSSAIIQPNAEITVPEITPSLKEQGYTLVETRTIVVTAQPEPTDTTELIEPTTVVNQGPSEREVLLTDRLNQAYSLLKQRDNEYQIKLKEAYDKLQAASAGNEGAASPAQASAPASPEASAQPAAASPTSAPQSDDHQEASEHHDDGNTSTTNSHESDSEHEGEGH